MTIVAAFKCKVHFNPSCAALSSKRAFKHFHSKDCILTVCFMGHLLCHGRPAQIISPPCWLNTSSTTAIVVYIKFFITKKMHLSTSSKVYGCACKQAFKYGHSFIIIQTGPGRSRAQAAVQAAAFWKLCLLQLRHLLHVPQLALVLGWEQINVQRVFPRSRYKASANDGIKPLQFYSFPSESMLLQISPDITAVIAASPGRENERNWKCGVKPLIAEKKIVANHDAV